MIVHTTLGSGVNRIFYRDGDERAVAVHPAGIVETILHVYGAGRLADELLAAGGG